MEFVKQSSIDAAFALAEADWVLVASGSGLSADSGLDTYEGLRDQGVDYDSLCRAELLYDKPELFQSFWLDSLLKYRATPPHEGFRILERLLRERADLGRVYLYTSNVDGHLRYLASTCCIFVHVPNKNSHRVRKNAAKHSLQSVEFWFHFCS